MEEEKKTKYKRVFTIHWTTREREEEIEVDEEDLFDAVMKLDYIITDRRYIPNETIKAERVEKIS